MNTTTYQSLAPPGKHENAAQDFITMIIFKSDHLMKPLGGHGSQA